MTRNNTEGSTGDEFEPEQVTSKSQKKRDMAERRIIAEKLVALNDEQLAPLADIDAAQAIRDCRKITKGNARKRQLQYIAKLLGTANIEEVKLLIDRFDASSKEHILQFHQLEKWREQLIAGELDVLQEISKIYPDLNRQQLRQLSRKAKDEQDRIRAGEKIPNAAYRKLFQHLKSLMDASQSDTLTD